MQTYLAYLIQYSLMSFPGQGDLRGETRVVVMNDTGPAYEGFRPFLRNVREDHAEEIFIDGFFPWQRNVKRLYLGGDDWIDSLVYGTLDQEDTYRRTGTCHFRMRGDTLLSLAGADTVDSMDDRMVVKDAPYRYRELSAYDPSSKHWTRYDFADIRGKALLQTEVIHHPGGQDTLRFAYDDRHRIAERRLIRHDSAWNRTRTEILSTFEYHRDGRIRSETWAVKDMYGGVYQWGRTHRQEYHYGDGPVAARRLRGSRRADAPQGGSPGWRGFAGRRVDGRARPGRPQGPEAEPRGLREAAAR